MRTRAAEAFKGRGGAGGSAEREKWHVRQLPNEASERESGCRGPGKGAGRTPKQIVRYREGRPGASTSADPWAAPVSAALLRLCGMLSPPPLTEIVRRQRRTRWLCIMGVFLSLSVLGAPGWLRRPAATCRVRKRGASAHSVSPAPRSVRRRAAVAFKIAAITVWNIAFYASPWSSYTFSDAAIAFEFDASLSPTSHCLRLFLGSYSSSSCKNFGAFVSPLLSRILGLHAGENRARGLVLRPTCPRPNPFGGSSQRTWRRCSTRSSSPSPS